MIKFKSLIPEDFKDWSDGLWIHYTDVDYVRLHTAKGSQTIAYNDPIGIYMFPEAATKGMKHHFFKQKKYKISIQVSSKLKIFDLAHLTIDDVRSFELDVEQLRTMKRYLAGGPVAGTSMSLAEAFYESLKEKFKDSQKLTEFLISKGYDAIFDDVGAIHGREKQLCVFDPNNLKIVKIEPNDL